jgi:alanyl aminopeptidase
MTLLRPSLLAAALLAITGAVRAADAVPTGPLPRTVVPSLVQLQLKLDPKQARFSGTTRIEATVAEATDTVWMHGRHLSIGKAEAVLTDGRRIALKAEDADVSGVLKITAASRIPAGQVAFEIAYDAPFGQLQGAYRVKPDGHDYIVTQMEALGARDTFPGFDEPSFKQPWDITLIVPQDDVAVANTSETRSEALGDGWKKVTFARTEALPSYLIAFAVGPWDVPAGPDIAPNGARTTPIKLRGLAAKGQGGRMRYSLQHTPEIVIALENYFGIPYPFDKLDNVAAPDFWAGAMENAGMIVYRDTLMFPDEHSATGLMQAYWGVSAHELAHQWFGDLVTTRWWDDIWLNEGFATWMGTKIHTQLRPDSHPDRGLLQGAIEAMAADSLASTRRIHEPIKDFTDIQSAFDGITYQKGAAVLGMFEHYIGEDKFRDGIRGYLRKHARGNATSADLVQALAAQSDDPARVSKAFFSFIDQPGVPFAKVALDCGGKTPAITVRQQRYLPLGSTASANGTWGIPMCVRYGDGTAVREQCGLVDGAQSRIELEQSRSCPSWVMPNAHGTGYYRYSLTPKLQDALNGAFARLDAREQRMAADSVLAAYDAGEVSPQQLVTALPQFTQGEMRQTVTAGSDDVRWMDRHLFADEQARAAFRSGIAAIYRPRLDQLGLAARENDNEDARLLRGALIGFFADTLKDPGVRAELAKQGRAGLGLTGAKPAPDAMARDLRGAALAVTVEDGGQDAFDAAETLYRASDDAELRGQLLRALGSARDPRLAERARALILEKGLMRRNEVTDVLASQVAEPETRTAARQWLDRNFDDLNARLAPAGARLLNLYSAGACSAEDTADLDKTFGERMRTVEGGPLDLKQAIEAAHLCVAQVDARRGQAPTF